jgi:regulator of replication initiation timing
VIDGFQQSNVANQTEMKELRQKLRDIYKEYDIVVSENYSLKATVKKLKDQKSESPAHTDSSLSLESNPESTINSNRANLRLYEDTRLLNANSLEDTSEIDLAQVM